MARSKKPKADVISSGDGQPNEPVLTAKQRYNQLVSDRDGPLYRAREAAELTIPSLMPPAGHNGSTKYRQPFQSVGAEGVNNLAAKLLLALFPPGSSFFRLTMDDFVLAELRKQHKTEEAFAVARADFEVALAQVERAVVNRMEQRGTRMPLFECFKHLIVAGNGLLQVLDDGGMKLHTLDNYVVKRDQAGNVLEVVVLETLSHTALPKRVREVVSVSADTTPESTSNKEKPVELYTWIKREDDQWTVYQEVNGKKIPESDGTYPLEKSPWLPLRFIAVPNNDYGRGFVEENFGALRSHESLEQSIVEGTAIMVKILLFVNESGVTSKKKIAEARNGAVIDGQAKDVTILQIEKFADMRVASEKSDSLKKDLQRAFLLLAGSQRNAERVTAEEIRLVAQELEMTLGGVYSVMAQELQRPLAVRYMHQMQKAGDLPRLPEKTVSPQIVTGIEGLGRNTEFSKLRALLQDVLQAFGPEAVAEWFNVGGYAKRLGAALSVDTGGVVREEQDVMQQRQQKAQQEAAKAAIAPAIGAAVQMQKNQQAAPEKAA